VKNPSGKLSLSCQTGLLCYHKIACSVLTTQRNKPKATIPCLNKSVPSSSNGSTTYQDSPWLDATQCCRAGKAEGSTKVGLCLRFISSPQQHISCTQHPFSPTPTPAGASTTLSEIWVENEARSLSVMGAGGTEPNQRTSSGSPGWQGKEPDRLSITSDPARGKSKNRW
jgi:hypothetical protein